ncbi:YraN family protein [Brevibacillus panacihumi]|uniref:UPF0102 protein EDM58_17445 n=1 Tax=Brevibacillus panacihumi TaxID=497735 RepID=A0A3M8CMC5_9BACL|nr:YraN family protein [Brevibacillus panacihumi]RNB76447.1 YraN family protein [Brevibacillus panacihumi]
MSMRRRVLGQQGEDLACLYLQDKGYVIRERNVRTRHGEIDVIALDGRTLVFVEVRTRTADAYGTAQESITWKKRQKLRELALAYLQRQTESFPSFRFDVIAITCPLGKVDGVATKIDHIEYAF